MNKHLKAAVIVGGLALLAFAATMTFKQKLSGEAPEDMPVKVVNLNEFSPDFEAKTISGTPLKLSQFGGKLVVLNFWASWCGPCVEEMPSLISLMKEFPQGIELVAVSGDSNLEDIEAFAKSFPELKTLPNIHLVWDGDKKITDLYHIDRLPESFLLSKDRRLIKRLSGALNWHSPDALEYIRGAIAAGAAGAPAAPKEGVLEPGKESESQDAD